MTIRAILDKHRLQEETDGGEGSAGGEGGEGGDNDVNKGSENNNKDNLISHENLWDTTVDNKSGGKESEQQQTTTQQQPDPNETFNKHIESLDFSGDIDLVASMKGIQDGDTEAFAKLINQIGSNAYRNALIDANKVVQQRVDKMAATVKSEVSSSNATSDLVKEMNTTLPFTKSPAFAPVANLTLTQFIQKGVPPNKAIEEVGKYFENLSGEISKMNPSAPSGRPAGNFGGSSNLNAGNQGEDAPDWIELLGGPAVS